MNLLKIIGVLTALLIFSSNTVYAYLDPGTGSMLLQGLIAGLMAAAATIGIYWRRVKSFLSGSKSHDSKSGNSHGS